VNQTSLKLPIKPLVLGSVVDVLVVWIAGDSVFVWFKRAVR